MPVIPPWILVKPDIDCILSNRFKARQLSAFNITKEESFEQVEPYRSTSNSMKKFLSPEKNVKACYHQYYGVISIIDPR